MTGPAVAVFDGVLNPELLPQSSLELRSQPPQSAAPATPTAETEPGKNSLNCANDCQDSCQQPDHCLRDEAQARVQQFLSSTSLDTMINLAGDSLEERIQSRFTRDEKL
jgi:diaminopimelate epimerase